MTDRAALTRREALKLASAAPASFGHGHVH